MHWRLWTPLVVFLATLALSESVKIHSGDVLASMRVAGRIVNKHLRLDEEVLSLGGGSFQRILDWIPSSTKVSVSIPNFHIKEPLSIRKPVHIASEDSQMTISCSGMHIKSDGVTLVGVKVVEGCQISRLKSIISISHAKDIHLEDIVCSGVRNSGGPGCMNIYHSDVTLENVRGSDNENWSTHSGGFLRALTSRVILNQCTFTENRVFGNGGAVAATYGFLTVSKSTFINNLAEAWTERSGGGLYAFHECLCNDEHITFKRLINLHVHKGGEYEVFDSTFVGNKAVIGWGGGAFLRGHRIKVINSFFEGNTAQGGGGGLAALICPSNCRINPFREKLHGTVEVSGCQFTGNSGGNWLGGGLVSLAKEIKVSNSNFEDNIINHHGGGLYSWAQTLTVSSCNFVNNTAINRGGGLRTFIFDQGSSHVNNCTFDRNAAINHEGGGVYCNGTAQELSLSGVLFDGNTAKGGSGGALGSHVPELTIADSVFHDNTAKIEGGAILTNASSMALYDSIFLRNAAPIGGGISASEDTATLSAEVIFVNSPTSPPLPLRNEPKPRLFDSAT